MTDYGGLGGIWEGRPLDEADAFEALLNRLFGDAVRADDETAKALWGALSNVEWHHANGDTAGFSFRRAGDVVAAIRGNGNYMEWYCSAPYGVVREDIREAMAAEGWVPHYYEKARGRMTCVKGPQTREEFLALPIVAVEQGRYTGLAILKPEGMVCAAQDEDGDWWAIEGDSEGGYCRRWIGGAPP